jgi:DNA repair exonuclease SbcCD ATPase subunit
MIVFEVIRWRNLLSTGNQFTEIKLNEHQNALIVGENGAGKSTILDALCFALFGKAFRKINKPSLVNSINEKGCEVQIEFTTNGKEYKIVRGIKPNLFEIYCDGTLINQDSATKDYQEHLEKFILKMNYKSFTQIVILGSASFVPFMQLSPADRRVIIEDLLDIQIFSVMNVIAKYKLQVNKQALEVNRITLAAKEEKKSYVEKTIASLKQNNEEKKSDWLAQLGILSKASLEAEKSIVDLEEKRESIIAGVTSSKALKDKHTKLVSLSSKIETNLKRTKKDLAFYCDNNNCPTCRQPIDSDFKATEVKSSEEKIAEYEAGIISIAEKISSIVKDISDVDGRLMEAETIRGDIQKDKMHVSSLKKRIDEIEDELEQLEHSDKLLTDNQNELIDTLSEITSLSDEKQKLLTERQYIETAISLLKDGGIKTKIIKQYLPIINKLINKYLAKMGFFVNFNINEQFEETIKSRYRDEFSYQNFSEGEKTRIDLALLFTWRAIAKMRNSVNTNLLILDEVLDGSLDNNGTDEFLKIMWDVLGDTNTFVISHKTDTMQDKFQKIYKFTKVKNFSRLDV